MCMNNQAAFDQTFQQELLKSVEDLIAKRLLPEKEYDLFTISNVIRSGVIEKCGEDLAMRKAVSIHNINEIERMAKAYYSLIMHGADLPIPNGFQIQVQSDGEITERKVLLLLILALLGARIEP